MSSDTFTAICIAVSTLATIRSKFSPLAYIVKNDVNYHRELTVQAESGDVAVNGAAECDELKRAEEDGDNYGGTPHSCDKATDPGTFPTEDDAARRTDIILESSLNELQCQVR